MFDDYMYHADVYSRPNGGANSGDSGKNNDTNSRPVVGRRRGRSILQSVATDTIHQSPAPSSGRKVKFPPKAEVPRRRANSIHLERKGKRDSGIKSKTFPLTEREMQEYEERKHRWMHDDFDVDIVNGFDELDLANNYDYIEFRETANAYSHSCNELLKQADRVMNYLDELSLGFAYVQKQTSTIEEASGSIVKQQSHLDSLSKNVEENLLVFTNLEKALRMLHSPGSDLVTKHRFKDLLADLDVGLDYVNKYTNFKDIDLYQMRYRQCMTRALTLAQTYFNNQIRDIMNQIQHQISSKSLNPTTQSALLYAKFENEASRLKEVTDHIAVRCDAHEEYNGLYEECLKTYLSARYKLVNPMVYKKFEEFASDPRNLVQLSRSCLSFYRQLCGDEKNLFDKFFSNGDNYFREWLSDLCDPLYDTLRQRIIRETSIDNLCELTSMLLSYDNSGDEEKDSINYAYVFQPVLHDVQSRLVFRVQTYIQSDIVQYVPKPEDLSEMGGHRKKDIEEEKNDEDSFNTETLFKGWYPPMRKAITLLSQIYQLVKSTVFDDLAHRIVHECMESLQKAQTLAVSRLGAIEAHLFFIKHLLTLRTQIMGFDIDYVPAEVLVDFSGLQEVFSKVRQEGVSFSGSGLLNLAKASVPKVVNDMFDAKEELYAKLKNSIHEFTEVSVQSIVKSILDNPDPKTAVEKTRQLRQDATTEFPRIRGIIETYIDDERTIDILIDSIQDLVIQTYDTYQQTILSMVKSPEDVDGMMEVDGLISWLGDIVGKLHKPTTSFYLDETQSTTSTTNN
jgi:hypothetical protein